MNSNYKKLTWQESKNGFVIDCSLDLFVGSGDSNIIFLTIPGVDGSIDGFDNKYLKISEKIQQKYGTAIVRMSNPFISSFYWQSNVRKVLNYITENIEKITNNKDAKIYIMAHSAGAAVLAQIAWEYPEITKILLVNTAFKLNPDEILKGLNEYKNEVTFVFGGQDPSVDWAKELKEKYKTIIIDGADHNFSGLAFEKFMRLADEYLF